MCFGNRAKTDMSYIMMEVAKMSERIDVLENESINDPEFNSVGAVNIEFSGKLALKRT